MVEKSAIHFIDYASLRLRKRDISKSEVLKTLTHPDRLIRQTANRFLAYRLLTLAGRQYLSIIIFEKNDKTTIITAFRTSKIQKYLNKLI